MVRRMVTVAFVSTSLLGALAPAARADGGKEPLVERVRKAIDRGVQFLRDQQTNDGNWEVDGIQSETWQGGWTSLAMLALLNAGVKADDPAIERGLTYLRSLPPKQTYVVGLQTMVFTAIGRSEDRERVQRNVDWLVQNRVFKGGQFVGWSYGGGVKMLGGSDNSNTQYALLGLHEANVAGAKIDPEVWEKIRDYYIRTQRMDDRGQGGWGYANLAGNGPTLTMSTAGLCGLVIAGMELNRGREVLLPDGTASNCGRYEENAPVAAAMAWIGSHYRLEQRGAIYYNLYGLERAGRLTGERFLGEHDWYREGCQYLVDNQSREGYWLPNGGGLDSYRVVATSFALLFLSKGRTPILISKLVHGPGADWNNDRNDCRHLVEYASRNLFQRLPLAWQTFDAKRGLGENTAEERLSLVGDLMQSPIAYFNGHHAPVFTDAEEEILRQYVEQGGFIFAEACCGREEFDRGFRDLMKRLFPDTPLKPLPPEHPVWHAHATVRPGAFPLEGIDRGCKTVVIYSPRDLSCLWESNQSTSPQGQLAFRLGANIIAYATGLEPPKPRLTPPDVIRDDGTDRKIPRGYLKAAQLRHEGDWQPAPRAMRNLMYHLQEKDRLLVALKTEAVHPSQEAVLDFKFLYMHGRNPFSFTNDERALDNLRANLQTGGLLFADACCGKRAFDASFREFVAHLFPGKKLEPIPLSDELFGKDLNGEAITRVRCRREASAGDGPAGGYAEVPPFLEGVRINNRWVIIYSKYDIGCALERHQSSDCLGHDEASALRLASAAVLYALKR